MRGLARIIFSAFLIAGLTAGVYGCVVGFQWLQSQGVLEAAFDRRPLEPIALSSLDRYTREAAGKAWFRRYFTTMVYGPDRGAAGVVAKWERPRVVIKQLNDGGPGMKGYLRRLVRRLNRIQDEVRFVVGDTAPLITISYLSHRDYVRSEGADSVGMTRTRYYDSSPGLISARISIDAGAQTTPGQVKSTLVHELTHAIGCAGHFSSPDDRRRSVLHRSSAITTWSQPDAAVIRVLYSPWIRTGMTAAEAKKSLRRSSRSGG